MIQGDDMAFPDPMRVIEQSYKECERGMNLRTYMAIKICAATWADPDRHNTSEERAALAVKQADDLIAELNKK